MKSRLKSITHTMFSRLRQGALVLGNQLPATTAFTQNRLHPGGGFQDRAGRSDLYYTAFGIDLLLALSTLPIPHPLASYILQFGSGESLGFMDLVSLARARRRLIPDQTPPEWRQAIAARLSRFRSAGGGYENQPGSASASATATFMACLAFESLDLAPDHPDRILSALQELATPDGAFSNLPGMPVGNTPSTAAALTLLTHFPGASLSCLPIPWLLNQLDPTGGFRAFPQAPIPDLLSTATALFALSTLPPNLLDDSSLDPALPSIHDFIAARRTPSGGYSGHAFDPVADVEYTYYALLALGSLHALSPATP